MKEVNLRRLIYFYEAVSSGTIRAAADKLNVAPSAISRQITQLEEELACLFIERNRKGVQPTEAGQILLDYYHQLSMNEDNLLLKLQTMRKLKSGNISLTIGEGFIYDILSTALPQFQELYPDLTLSIHIASSNEAIRRIQEDKDHIGVLFYTPHNQMLRSHEVIPHPLHVITPPEHPLTRLNRPLELAEIAAYPIALQEAEFGVRQLIAKAEFNNNIRLSPTITVNSFALMKRFVQSNMGITILPEFAVREEIENKSVVTIPLADPILLSGEIHVITRLGRQLTSAPLTLLKHLVFWVKEFNK